MFPIIPLLAIGAIIGGALGLDWYYSKTKAEREEADRLALRWFGKRFQELAEFQQYRVKNYIDQNYS